VTTYFFDSEPSPKRRGRLPKNHQESVKRFSPAFLCDHAVFAFRVAVLMSSSHRHRPFIGMAPLLSGAGLVPAVRMPATMDPQPAPLRRACDRAARRDA
jgi:hypothetical protein